MDDIYSKIYGDSTNDDKNKKKIENDEEIVNPLIPAIVGFSGIIISLFCLFSLVLCYSFDLCVFLDNYFIYIVGMCGLIMLIGIYFSTKSIKQKFNLISLINIIISLLAIILFIIPIITGLLYFNF